jgi:hypothetical protein
MLKGSGLSGDTLLALEMAARLMPLALMVMEGVAGNAQRFAKKVHKFGAGDTTVPASSAIKDDVEPTCQALPLRRGAWGRGPRRVVVDDR